MGPVPPLITNEPDALPTCALVPPGPPNEADPHIATHIPTLSLGNLPMAPQPVPAAAIPLSAAEWSLLIAKAQAGDLPHGASTPSPVQVQPLLSTHSLPPCGKM